MHNAACFGGGERTCTLLNHFKRETERHRALTPNIGLKRFALDQFHDIETLTILLAVMTDTRDIRMVNLRSGARFSEETRAHAGISRRRPVDHFERDLGVQYRIASAERYCHRSCSELDRKTIRANFYFEVLLRSRSSRQSPSRFS